LVYLNLSLNNLSNGIPSSLGNLSQLQNLTLSFNNLTGSIPASLGNLSNLTNLDLSFNSLSGPITNSLGNLNQLQGLSLQDNELTGSIPATLRDLSHLQDVALYDNNLCGDMPYFSNFTSVLINVTDNMLTIGADTQSLTNINLMISAGNTVLYTPQNPSSGCGEGIDLVATSVSWDTTVGGVNFAYAIQGGPTSIATTAALFWANGPNLSNELSTTPAYTNEIPAGSDGANSGFVFNSSLTNIPPQATYILLVIDPNNLITETNKSNNILALPLVRFGIDVSALQGTITWSQVTNDSIAPVFAYVRASKGRTNIDSCDEANVYCDFTDSTFTNNIQAARNVGLLVGAYHVPTITNTCQGILYSPTDEADFFVSVAGPYLTSGCLRPALDLEDNSCGSPITLGTSNLSSWVVQWMAEVQRLTGVIPLLYCNGAYLSGLDPSLATSYDLYFAHYESLADALDEDVSPWPNWTLFQFSQTGSILGIVPNVDLDVFQGSPQQFQGIMVIPAAQFNPNAQVVDGQFQVEVFAPGKQQVGIQASQDLNSWTDVATLPTSYGKATFTDNVASHEARFYRIQP